MVAPKWRPSSGCERRGRWVLRTSPMSLSARAWRKCVFCAWSSLGMWLGPFLVSLGFVLDLSVGVGVHHLVAPSTTVAKPNRCAPQSSPGRPYPAVSPVCLVRPRAHRWSMAALKKKASGRRPVDGHRDRGVGVAQVKAGVEALGVVGRRWRPPGATPAPRGVGRVPSPGSDQKRWADVVLALAQ